MNKREVFKDCTGIAVMKEGKVLLGLRQDGQGWGLAGGKKEAGETLEACARRELKEEFGLEAIDLEYVGIVEAEATIKGVEKLVAPSIYVCNRYIGELNIDKDEHEEYIWVDLREALKIEKIFPPSREGIKLVLEYFGIIIN
ncbi:NUDIX domain-containing protein [Alkaliphilus hydrothermalis]|uniref:8-oxo-dGTP pyrophosphatase MutT (NUDIX family) n=1 Tax=Alkaliphilus hydrothermalis TaxID=1482730 RepID=A0ABS2NT27_9FIRM|nr:NUDIX hydrolase [Alkaliphilus hydrothermalis]MBM7616093.1 8-oxo-dGTP pyrophosphatase MutT (NUDIX family) [Alkaliphilus hydrothermalis]